MMGGRSLSSSDNFVIDPQYFDSLPQEQKETIGQFYIDTVISNVENHDDE